MIFFFFCKNSFFVGHLETDKDRLCLLCYLFINYNKIANYSLIIYELSNFDQALGVVTDQSLWWESKPRLLR